MLGECLVFKTVAAAAAQGRTVGEVVIHFNMSKMVAPKPVRPTTSSRAKQS